MISKRTRKSTRSVEQLKQGSFTAAKSMDEKASVLDTEHVLFTKNLTADFDGGLILRKPIKKISDIPDIEIDGVVVNSEVIAAYYLYTGEGVFILRKTSDGMYYWNIFSKSENNYVPARLKLTWRTWIDYTLYTKNLQTNLCNYLNTPYLNFENIKFTNTSTTTICTNVKVELSNSMFRREDGMYLNNLCTDLFYNKLYDHNLNATNLDEVSVFKPRTLIISKSTDADRDFDINITSPECNTIQTSEAVSLDINLDLDNPYSIRDVYGTSAPTIKNILAYVPTTIVNGVPQASNPEHLETKSVTEIAPTLNKPVFNDVPFYPTDFESDFSPTYTFRGADEDGATYPPLTFALDLHLYGDEVLSEEYNTSCIYVDYCRNINVDASATVELIVDWYDTGDIRRRSKFNLCSDTFSTNFEDSFVSNSRRRLDAIEVFFNCKLEILPSAEVPQYNRMAKDALETLSAEAVAYIFNEVFNTPRDIYGKYLPENMFPASTAYVKKFDSIFFAYNLGDIRYDKLKTDIYIDYTCYDSVSAKYVDTSYVKKYILER